MMGYIDERPDRSVYSQECDIFLQVIAWVARLGVIPEHQVKYH